jgi:hypothetical protein
MAWYATGASSPQSAVASQNAAHSRRWAASWIATGFPASCRTTILRTAAPKITTGTVFSGCGHSTQRQSVAGLRRSIDCDQMPALWG